MTFQFRKPGGAPTAPPPAAAPQPFRAAPAAAPAPAPQYAPVPTTAPAATQSKTVAPPPGFFRGTSQVGNIFSKLYFKEGTYWARLDVCKMVELPSKEKALVVEETIVRVVAPSAESNTVGSKPSHMMKTSWMQWQRGPKNLCMAAYSMTQEEADAMSDDEWDTALGQTFGPDNPLHGRIVEITATQVLTNLGKQLVNQGLPEEKVAVTKGALFTQHNYTRRVSYQEVVATVPQEDLSRIFKAGELQAALEAEQRELAAQG